MTTPEQVIDAGRIADQMRRAGLDVGFVAAALRLATEHEGAYDLMSLWEEAADAEDKDAAIADLHELLEDVEEAPASPEQKPYIPYKDLPAIAKQVREHKRKLRDLIDRHGGVTEVARRCGIPQPSLSRMLNSASMPRRTTLYRIANALNVPESEVVGEWLR